MWVTLSNRHLACVSGAYRVKVGSLGSSQIVRQPPCRASRAWSLSRVWPFVAHGLEPPGSSVQGISQQGYWSRLPFPPPGDLPNPEMELVSPAPAGGFFTTAPPDITWYCTGVKRYKCHHFIQLLLAMWLRPNHMFFLSPIPSHVWDGDNTLLHRIK